MIEKFQSAVEPGVSWGVAVVEVVVVVAVAVVIYFICGSRKAPRASI